MTTGEKIATLRKKNNLTQEQLAEVLGVARQSVSRWEMDVHKGDLAVGASYVFGKTAAFKSY